MPASVNGPPVQRHRAGTHLVPRETHLPWLSVNGAWAQPQPRRSEAGLPAVDYRPCAVQHSGSSTQLIPIPIRATPAQQEKRTGLTYTAFTPPKTATGPGAPARRNLAAQLRTEPGTVSAGGTVHAYCERARHLRGLLGCTAHHDAHPESWWWGVNLVYSDIPALSRLLRSSPGACVHATDRAISPHRHRVCG